jgi:hypothetical protein
MVFMAVILRNCECGSTGERSGDGELHDGYGNLGDVYDVIHDQSPCAPNTALIMNRPTSNIALSHQKKRSNKSAKICDPSHISARHSQTSYP